MEQPIQRPEGEPVSNRTRVLNTPHLSLPAKEGTSTRTRKQVAGPQPSSGGRTRAAAVQGAAMCGYLLPRLGIRRGELESISQSAESGCW